MPPCRPRRPESSQDEANAWLRREFRLAFLVAGLICAGNGGDALAQNFQNPDTAKPLTAAKIRKACARDHAKFCPIGQGGTRPDIACLQQHHVNLTIGCRSLLRQAANKPGGNPGGGVPQ